MRLSYVPTAVMFLAHGILSFILLSSVKVSANGCSTANYTGNVHITNGGRVCQSWADQEPHRHTNNNDAMFVHDGSVEEARNYCRQLLDDARPWCYTIDIYKRWEHCDLRICGENGQCGGVITDESGTISSTDVDNNGQYDADKDCLWTLMAPEGQFVELNMLTFNLQPSSTCALDFLQVYEDTFTHGRYCGNNIHPVIISKSRLLYLRFFSDSQDEATGFTFRFSHVSTGLKDIPQEYVSGELICPRDVDLLRYSGDVSTTNSGHECIAWKHISSFPKLYFDVDGSRKKAKAYCRNINVMPNTMPWCISSVTFQDEYCQEKICRVSDAATKTNDTIFVSVLMPTPTISTVDSTSTASYTTHSTTDNSTPSMQTSTQSALRPTAITRNETMSAVNLTTTGGNVSTGPQATTVSNYTTPSVTGNSTPLMQSTNQSTTLRPTEHSLLETTLGIELTTQSALRPTVITRNETMSTVNLTTSGNVSTGPWSRVVGCTTRNVGYHTTDYSTKSGGPELHFEMFTVFLAILTTPVVVQNAMKR